MPLAQARRWTQAHARVQAYLIEVNTCPALACHGAVLQDLLPRVMEEVVQKAIDPLFPPTGGRASAATAALAVQGRTSDATDASDGASESSKGGTPRSDGAGGGCEAGGLPAKLDGFKLLLGRLPTRRAQIDRSASLQITSKETAAGAFSGALRRGLLTNCLPRRARADLRRSAQLVHQHLCALVVLATKLVKLVGKLVSLTIVGRSLRCRRPRGLSEKTEHAAQSLQENAAEQRVKMR